MILTLAPVDALDVIGPAEVSAFANSLHKGGTEPYSLELVSSSGNHQIKSHTGIALTAHRTLEEERDTVKAIDTLIVTSDWNPMEQLDESAIEWSRTRGCVKTF